MFFVLQHIWKKCSPNLLISNNEVIDPTSQSLLGPFALDDNDTTKDGVAIPAISEQRDGCDYSMLGKKMLMIFQATLIPGLYLTLVGADHMRTLTDFRHLEEVKMRVFWVVVDILDLLQLQSSLWETNTHKFPYKSAAVIYFYCYLSLIILPPISLSEMSKREGSLSPHKMIFYLTASVALVNLGTTVIRSFFLFYYVFNLTSSVFLAKNIICLGIHVSATLRLVKCMLSICALASFYEKTKEYYYISFLILKSLHLKHTERLATKFNLGPSVDLLLVGLPVTPVSLLVTFYTTNKNKQKTLPFFRHHNARAI